MRAQRECSPEAEGGRRARLYGVDDARLQVKQQRSRHVVLVVRLVEEHILAVARPLRRVVLQHTVLADPVFQAQLPSKKPQAHTVKRTHPRHTRLPPELGAYLVAALTHLQRDDFATNGRA